MNAYPDDLFSWKEERSDDCRYPLEAGHKGDLDTSQEAAESMAPALSRLRQACLEALSSGDWTADEIAGRIGESILAVRPRLSELRALEQVEATSCRRKNASGRNAVVWRRAGAASNL